jgi:hypothetical protein
MELPQRAELIPQVRTELELQAYLGRARSFATTHLRAREFPVEDERVTGEGGRGGGRPGSSSARELSRFYLCFSFLFFLSSPLGRKDSRTRSSGTLPLMQSADRRSHDSQQRRNHSVIARLDDRSTHYARTRGRARVIDVVIGRSRERFWQRFDTHYDPNDRPPR